MMQWPAAPGTETPDFGVPLSEALNVRTDDMPACACRRCVAGRTGEGGGDDIVSDLDSDSGLDQISGQDRAQTSDVNLGVDGQDRAQTSDVDLEVDAQHAHGCDGALRVFEDAGEDVRTRAHRRTKVKNLRLRRNAGASAREAVSGARQ